jgi:hypothetical protein
MMGTVYLQFTEISNANQSVVVNFLAMLIDCYDQHWS